MRLTRTVLVAVVVLLLREHGVISEGGFVVGLFGAYLAGAL